MRLIPGRPSRRLLALALALGLVAGVGVGGSLLPGRSASTWTGRVLDLAGLPIEGAQITIGDHVTRSDGDGSFRLSGGPRAGWIRAEAFGYLSRVRAAASEHEVILRLTPDDGRTVSIVFGGDVMAGRRFFDMDEDGDRRDAILDLAADGPAYARLLDGVRPALEAADLAVVNLETPLLDEPWFDPTAPRPAAFHPTKEFAFASGRGLAEGLRLAGVDITGLANNHLHDALDAGVDETLATLDAAGFGGGTGRYGGGLTSDAAWIPAIREVRGTRIAFLGCTTIGGEEHAIRYVATPTSAGAAACDVASITRNVAKAALDADVVVFSIHGGFEYQREPSDQIALLSRVARDAGATLVVNHHPHVVGGVEAGADGLTAWTMGNLLFDQTVWPTFPSYLLTVYLRDGKPIRAVADPMLLDGFLPVGLTGDAADRVARLAAARSTGPVVVADGSLEIGLEAASTAGTTDAATAGTIERLARGWEPAPAPGGEVGRDLLFLGTFEDDDADGETEEGDLWLPPARDRAYDPRAAATGAGGARLSRDAGNIGDAVLAPAHRVPVTVGRSMTFLARVRSADVSTIELQLGWYNDLRGASQERSVVALPVTKDWTVVRVDVVVPANAVAVQPYLRLGPPRFGRVSVDIDDVALVEWLPSEQASAETVYLRSAGGAVPLIGRAAAGEALPAAPGVEPIAGAPNAVLTVGPLAPGPAAPPVE